MASADNHPMIDTLLEKNWIPDFLIRHQIRRLNRRRLRAEAERDKDGNYVGNHSPVHVMELPAKS